MAKQTFTTGQVLTAQQMNDLQSNDFNQTVSTKTDSYVLVVGDRGTRVVMNAATNKTITVDTGIFSAGDTVFIHNIGAGVCTVTAGTATVNTAQSLALNQWEGGTLYFTSSSSAIFWGAGAGDITGVTAGTGISGGGSSGSVTITNSMATTIDAKGDIIVGSGSDAFGRLPVGTNGYTIVADSSETLGVKWQAPSSPSFVGCRIFNSTDFTSNSGASVKITFNSEDIDTDAFHSTSSNTSRITIPSGKGGKYLFTYSMGWSHVTGTPGTGVRVAYLIKNGSTYAGGASQKGDANTTTYCNGSFIVDAVATDYFEIEIYQNSGDNTSAVRGGTLYNNFCCQYLGA